MWSVLWERVPILFVQLENVEISRESRFRSLTCQTSYFARFHTIIGSSCASPNFMWWWCLKFVRKCSQYKFCNGWVDPSLDHWEYFGISTTFVKSIIIVITFLCILLDTRSSYMHFKDLKIKGKPQALKMFSITKSKTPQMRAWPWHILMSPFVCSTKYIRSNSWMTAVKREIKCISEQIHQILDYSFYIKS